MPPFKCMRSASFHIRIPFTDIPTLVNIVPSVIFVSKSRTFLYLFYFIFLSSSTKGRASNEWINKMQIKLETACEKFYCVSLLSHYTTPTMVDAKIAESGETIVGWKRWRSRTVKAYYIFTLAMLR